MSRYNNMMWAQSGDLGRMQEYDSGSPAC